MILYIHIHKGIIVATWGRVAADCAVDPLPDEAAALPPAQQWVHAVAIALAHCHGATGKIADTAELCYAPGERQAAITAANAICSDNPRWTPAMRDLCANLRGYDVGLTVCAQTRHQYLAIAMSAEKVAAESLSFGVGGLTGLLVRAA